MKQVKITAMTVFVTDIPVRLVRRHGSGDVAGSVKNAILKLETDAGITGWGDAAPWAVFTGTIEANVAALHIYLRPLLIGADPHRIEELTVAADHAVVGHPEAKAAMEMALFDIVGQASGLPVAELLGGRCRDDIPLSFSVADPDVDRDMDMVKRLYGEGLRLFKMKGTTGGRKKWHAEVGPRLQGGRPRLLFAVYCVGESFERLVFPEIGDREAQRIDGNQFVGHVRLENADSILHSACSRVSCVLCWGFRRS